jgi:S-adenosylmethionine:tRNA ribosyltransferase-isomerase
MARLPEREKMTESAPLKRFRRVIPFGILSVSFFIRGVILDQTCNSKVKNLIRPPLFFLIFVQTIWIHKSEKLSFLSLPAMDHPRKIHISDFIYHLPAARIAQFPLGQRDQSKMLLYREGNISEDKFLNLANHLPSKSTVIFNETRVVHARLLFRKSGGSQIEIFCLEPAGETKELQMAFQEKGETVWLCMVGNSRRWTSGCLVAEVSDDNTKITLQAERLERSGLYSRIRFTWKPESLTLGEILGAVGKVPLPPYITRTATDIDEKHYQTIYANKDGSVAAPTAGLHFTGDILKSLDDKGFRRINFTLHVGAGTFRPVISERIGEHTMHPEQVFLEISNLKKLYESLNDSITLVGTTSVRMMESLYWHGVKMITGMQFSPDMQVGQWEPYEIGMEHGITRKDSLEKVIEDLERNGRPGLTGETRLMIAPGYKFMYPDVLITNFHQPGSTLLLLVAAFIGQDWKKTYQYALDHQFRFLSYGDSCVFCR